MRLGYIRVSTVEQNEARQEVLMEQLGVERVFIDKQTGTNTNRPALKELMEFVLRNRFQGLDRIVPIGETTAFSLTWDGYNLIEMFSRIPSFF